MMMDHVKGPKVAGIPARQAECGTIVKCHREGGAMMEGEKSYMRKADGEASMNESKIKRYRSKEVV